jgi:hypothetical protein
MERPLDLEAAEISGRKIFSDKTFWVAAFLGGPLAGGYLFAENYKTLQQAEKVKRTYIITIVSVILFFVVIFILQDTVKIPRTLYAIGYISIITGLFNHFQEKQVSAYIAGGGQIHSWERVIMTGIICLIITVITGVSLVVIIELIRKLYFLSDSAGF